MDYKDALLALQEREIESLVKHNNFLNREIDRLLAIQERIMKKINGEEGLPAPPVEMRVIGGGKLQNH